MRPIVEFLLELFDMDECPKPMRTKIRERIGREIEILNAPPPIYTKASISDSLAAAQAPSMQRLMQQNPDIMVQAPQPTTPAAAQALAARQALIHSAGIKEPEPGRKSPRKM